MMDHASRIDAYRGGKVDRQLAEVALDFMVALEADEDDPDAWEKFKQATEQQTDRIKVVDQILRAYGESIEPRTLKAMQDAFYSFSNSLKYRATATSISCVRACLDAAWDGIGPWRK